MMLWFTLSLLTALAVSGRDLAIKSFAELKPLDIATLELLWSLPFLALGFLLVPAPALDGVFWEIFIFSLPLNFAAYFLYLYAIKISPLSLTVPFLSFTPLFMILTGFITLGETVNGWGGLGILAIAAGSYVLNFPLARQGLFKPFMVAVKRSSILFSVFLSWLILKEGDYRSCRGLGTLLITVLG